MPVKKKPAKKIKDYVSDKVFDGTRPVTGKRLERLKEKRTKDLAKRVKETFEIGSFTERGARSLRRIYEHAGYKFISHRIADNALIMQKFESQDQ